jgi:CRISPR-associated endoribonuclease Cas6
MGPPMAALFRGDSVFGHDMSGLSGNIFSKGKIIEVGVLIAKYRSYWILGELEMRLRISLVAEEAPLLVPIQYNHLLQGLIYNNLDKALSEWLHEEGYSYGTRRFKLFTFSRLFGKREVENGRIRFSGPAHFYLSAVDAEVLGSLAEHLLKKPSVRLGSAECRVAEVGVEPEPEVDPANPVRVKVLSPITAYSTLSTPDGRKKTYYYSPQEREWGEALISNLKRKAKALGWAADVDEDLKEAWVRPYKVRMADQKILNFKGTVIKGWTGLYEVKLPEPYFRLGYDAGFGAKNAQGFGMVDVINGGRRGGKGA